MAEPTFFELRGADDGETAFEQFTELDGREYIFRFFLSARDDSWYMSIADQNDVQLIDGIKVVNGVFLLRPYQSDARLPQGNLFAIDPAGGGDAGADELGTRVLLIYETEATAQELS